MDKYDLNDTRAVVYYESCDEFEKVRDICLLEDNWLKKNYTKENLVIEDHKGYCVVYQNSTNKPIVMGGVFNDGRFPNYVARMCNRLYTFPDFRMTRTQMIAAYRVANLLVEELMKVNDFECYFITMQNREARPNKRWWQAWHQSMNATSNDAWTVVDGYIQGCPHNVQKCWQNFVYRELVEGSFNRWNPTIIDEATWQDLEPGI